MVPPPVAAASEETHAQPATAQTTTGDRKQDDVTNAGGANGVKRASDAISLPKKKARKA